MGPVQLQLLLILVLSAAVSVLANIALAGPYSSDVEEFSPCDEIGSLSIDFNVKLVSKDGRSVYEGNITFPYDLDDENLLTNVKTYIWGSTGGWGEFYNVTQYDFIPYTMNNFPNVFAIFFGPMGITGKPAPAGTYHIENFRPTGFKLKKMDAMMFGYYKLMAIQSKDGVDLGCLQFIVYVKEAPADKRSGTPNSG
ncbi:uncharacterized protein LOC126146595 [Schistocerca cancellata]|uniref:uncharacterized protein LOC126146595 n=1 Tax=Schistocerca cancellata TaxID=274614 RepID=UPI0021179ED0|nr:uncharacterized protein LOC126146595 [Schistocerca cancellata]